jgi:hypothetical protein
VNVESARRQRDVRSTVVGETGGDSLVEPGYCVTHIDEIDTVRFPDEPLPDWKPLRRALGITAFGTNAYVAERPGDLVIERHDELAEEDDPGGSEEVYVVVRGAARFTVDGTAVDVARRRRRGLGPGLDT